jgi:hypothetical protein
MAKQTGLNWTTFSVDNSSGTPVDIRNDVTTLEFDTPREAQEVTGIDKSAYERLLLLADFTVSCEGVLNTAASQSHAVFSTVPSTSVNRTVSIGIGGKTLACETLFTTYAISRGDDGSATFSTEGSLADGATPTWA